MTIPSLAPVLPPENIPKSAPPGQKTVDSIITGVVSLPLEGPRKE
jgi:hypothetical protein